MSIIQINTNNLDSAPSAIFSLGFRPFFLGSSIFAVLSIVAWMLLYTFRVPFSMHPISNTQWHSHEMIYGYGMGVIAGFLLTAVSNWTGVQTIRGRSLVALFSFWFLARILFLGGSNLLWLIAASDIVFMIFLLGAIATPIVIARQWQQLGIVTKLVVLTIGNLLFYLGAFGIVTKGVFWGIYGGLYLIISLILVIGSRVVPAFIASGVGYDVEVPNPKWVTAVSLVLFLVFIGNQLFIQNQMLLGGVSSLLCIVNTWRLVLWHTPGIWKKPLLWCLYASFLFIDFGFLLFALSAFIGISPFLAIHAFAYGGIGLATIAMMARVTLGHTGRNVKNIPPLLPYALGLLVLGATVRTLVPLIEQEHYVVWIFASQVLWIGAFVLFVLSYSKMLLQPRIDGRPG